MTNKKVKHSNQPGGGGGGGYRNADIVTKQFTRFLIQEKCISPNRNNRLRKDELIRMFEYFKQSYNSPLNSNEIVQALDAAKLLKRKHITCIEDKTNFVEFDNSIISRDYIVDTLTSRITMKSQHSLFRNKSERDPATDDLRCHICTKVFCDSELKTRHLQTELHILRDKYRTKRIQFPKTITNLEVTTLSQMTVGINEDRCVEIVVTNIAPQPFYTFDVLDIFQLVDLDGVRLEFSKFPFTIAREQSFHISMHVRFDTYGLKLIPFILKVVAEENTHDLLVEAIFEVLDKELEYLGPREPYRPLTRMAVQFEDLTSVKGIGIDQGLNSLERRNIPHQYRIPKSLVNILETGFRPFGTMNEEEELELVRTRFLLCNPTQTDVLHNKEALNEENYVKRLHLLMWIEEHQIHKEIQMYNQVDVLLQTHRKDQGLFGIHVPDLAEGRPSVLKGDVVFIRRKGDDVKFEGVVHIVEDTTIFVAPHESLVVGYECDENVDIEFSFSRSPLKLSHRALDQVQERNMASMMFPTAFMEAKKKKSLKKPMFNPAIEKNPEQYQAVKNIVENRAYPAPYLLFGPPGTGKTATLVEAITQIWSIFDQTRICVCAPSNSAANVITERLLKHIPMNQILRLYAISREIPKDLEKCSNYDRVRKELFIPSVNQIRSKRIVVMTPVTAGRLVTAGITGGFFDYLFMDEAGHAIEVEMLIPIIGFLTKYRAKVGKEPKNPKEKRVTGSLILAGDPKQLGPVIQSGLAVHLGYDMSLLERLMCQCSLYQRDPEYDPRLITKLLKNYRSHPEILRIPNECFYDTELQAVGGDIIYCACSWEGLEVANFPVIFHSVKGRETRECTSPSYFNVSEIQVVSAYLKQLLGTDFNGHTVTQNDIGIITPYKKQVSKIKQHMKNKDWDDVAVASVEEFQGQEKLIIIISTVRSRFEFLSTDYQFGLGFLRNEKRFNVALTRAVALLIVIGNPDILQCDKNWRRLIYHCMAKKSYRGETPNGAVPEDFDPYTKLAPDLSALTINAY